MNWLTPCCLGVLVGLGTLVAPVGKEVHAGISAERLNVHESHASASLLGQFRTSISSWLWLRTDLYLHNGVEMRPLTESEARHGGKGASSADNHEGKLHDDETITTVIPAAEQDFRGLFGDIEREMSAYRSMKGHTHTNPKSTLPLFRLMTWIDPQFVLAWTTGSTVIAWGNDPSGVDKSLKFLREGQLKNPLSVTIHNEIGYTLVRRKKMLTESIPEFARAIELGGAQFERLDEDEKDVLLKAHQWLAMVCRDTGRIDEMHEVLRDGLKRFPEDAILTRLGRPTVLLRRDSH